MKLDQPHILIVDDDEQIRKLIQRFLIKNGYGVSTARNAAHARRLLEGLAFDLLVIDVMMPGEDGLSLTRDLRTSLDTPIMILTAKGESEDRIEGLECGADDYLAKPFEPRELLLRISAILRRTNEPPQMLQAEQETAQRRLNLGECSYDIERGELWRGETFVRLTTSELSLLRVLAGKPGEPVARAELLSAMVGDEQPTAHERAIDVQVTRLRRKIEADPKAPRYLQTVRGSGYMLSPD